MGTGNKVKIKMESTAGTGYYHSPPPRPTMQEHAMPFTDNRFFRQPSLSHSSGVKSASKTTGLNPQDSHHLVKDSGTSQSPK
jgi:hypothetical protein